jgi:ABC-type Mn2+/Zn2+ transport system permease subunit
MRNNFLLTYFIITILAGFLGLILKSSHSINSITTIIVLFLLMIGVGILTLIVNHKEQK